MQARKISILAYAWRGLLYKQSTRKREGNREGPGVESFTTTSVTFRSIDGPCDADLSLSLMHSGLM